VGATALFIPPAVLVALFLLRNQRRTAVETRHCAAAAGTDRWRPFLILTAVEVVRSVMFFGVNTFIELYWIRHLHADRGVAGAALACFLVGGVGGTLLGGRIADRFGLVRTVQVGTMVGVPVLAVLRLCPGAHTALVAAAAAGIAINIPFSVLVRLGQ